MPTRIRPAEFDNDLYGVLGVQRSAAGNQIKDAFQLLVRQPDSEQFSRYPSFHPQSSTPSASARSSAALPESPRHSERLSSSEANRRYQDINEAYRVLSDPDSRAWYDKSTENKKPKRSTKKKPAPPIPSSESFHSNHHLHPTMPEPSKTRPPQKSALKRGENVSDPTSNRPPVARPTPPRVMTGLAHVPRISTTSNSMLPVIPESPQPEEQHFALSPPTTTASFSTGHRSSASLFSPQFGRGSSQVSSMAFSNYSLSNNSPHEIQHPLPHHPGDERTSPERGPLRALNPDPDSDQAEHSPVISTGRLPQHSSHSHRRVTKSESHLPPPSNSNFIPHHPEFPRSHSDPEPRPNHLSSNGDSPKTKRNVSIKDEASYFDGSSAPPRSRGHARSQTDGQSSGQSSYGRQATRKSIPMAERVPAEWIYPLPLSLEELHNGDQQQYKITQHLLDGTTKDQFVDINIQPGWKNGTKIIFPKMGNQRPDGTFQDVVFIVEQLHHERFARLEGGRLVVNMEIDFIEALKDGVNDKRQPMKIRGLDSNPIDITVARGIIRNGMETIVRGAGMPMRSKSKVVGKGDLIVRWTVRYPSHLSPQQLEAMRSILEM